MNLYNFPITVQLYFNIFIENRNTGQALVSAIFKIGRNGAIFARADVKKSIPNLLKIL